MNMGCLLGSMYRIRLISASITDIINYTGKYNISLYNLTYIDDLHADCFILSRDYEKLSKLVTNKGAEIQLLSKYGLFWTVKNLISRPILCLGLLFIFLLDLYIPTRVLFIQVEGNKSVGTETIIEVVERCGLQFGASRREVRSEKIKNALLASIPQLQWAGINTAGCVATVSVQEGNVEKESKKTSIVNSIIASHDGVIQRMTVTAGSPLCKVGQAVKKGETLVSGYTDLGLMIQLNNAEAEIIAITNRQIEALHPINYKHRSIKLKKDTRYFIILGKNIIKLHNDSGISDSTCVKMYHERQLSLPGGFKLPLCIIKETQTHYTTQDSQKTDPTALAWVKYHVQHYLNQQMVAGSVLLSDFTENTDNHVYNLYGKFLCMEAIGKKHNEEILNNDG